MFSDNSKKAALHKNFNTSSSSTITSALENSTAGDVLRPVAGVTQAVDTLRSAQGVIQKTNSLRSGSPESMLDSVVSEAMAGLKDEGLKFTLSVQGLEAQRFAVVSFSMTEALSLPWHLNVELVSADPAVDFAAVLDKDATLSVWMGTQLQRSVKGLVAAFVQGDTGQQQTYYSMTVRPELWRATLRRNSRIFQQQKPQDIIETLLRENSVVSVAFALRHSHSAREFCVQYQEDDFSFIQRLAAEEGMFYYFELQDGNETLVFADDAGALPGGVALPWNPGKESSSNTLFISSFRRGAQIRPASVALKDYTFKNPDWHGSFSEMAREVQSQGTDYEYYDFPGRFKDDQHGQDFTRYVLDGLRNNADGGDVQSNDFRLYPGLLFSLANHPRQDLNTRWQVVSISHQGHQPQALVQENSEQGTTLSNQFSVVPAHKTWRPMPLPKPKIDGAQIGIVVGPPGEEIYCDEFARVRVRFLWDRYASGDDKSSCWIRVSQPWAGQGWGMIATPRVGQEVVVDFLHGDPDQPIIIGRTYHANNLPAIGLPGAKTQMAFRSKTHKGEGFNELKFEDAGGQEMLSMHAQKDMDTSVRNDRNTQVDNNHSENIGVNQSVTVGSNQTTDVGADQLITVGGNRTKSVTGNENITVTGNQEEAITGTQTLTITGAATQTFSATQDITVTGPQTLTVNAAKTDSITGLMTATYSSGHDVTVTGAQGFTVTATHTTDAKSILLKASSDITLECGASTITLYSSGTIDIKGTKINIDGNSITSTATDFTVEATTISSSGSSEHIVSGGTVKLNA